MALRDRSRPWHIGLTGGIGSGKSTVSHMLAARGASVIDADQIARAMTAPGGPAIAAIRTAFGAEFIDANSALDRARMRELAFKDSTARSRLEAIVHPLVGLHTQLQADAAHAAGSAMVVFDVPLLTESGRWAHRLDAVIVIDCSAETQIERVMLRSGFERHMVEGIIASQASRSARRAIADVIIYNDKLCSLTQLETEVAKTVARFGL